MESGAIRIRISRLLENFHFALLRLKARLLCWVYGMPEGMP
jgi:hypothetical protein